MLSATPQSDAQVYVHLLDATIAHLERLKDRGVAWIPVRHETLASMTAMAPRSNAPKPTAAVVSPGPSAGIRPIAVDSAPRSPVVQGSPALEAARVVPNPSLPIRSEAAISRWSRAAAAAPASPLAPKISSTPRSSAPLPPPLDPESRAAAMAELRSQILACSRCSHLVASRNSVVFGVGDIHARILFVGEAPGADEDLRGEPFVGKAGELLTKIITAMGLTRDSVFIANILKCRPDTPGQASGNRKPSPEEMATCIPWLERQIDLVQPQVMVALGATAVEGLLGKGTTGITQLRGSWQDYRGIPLMPTYHPAYLLRNQALSEKRKVWEDMLQVLERARYPVSAKQRGFFLAKE